MRLGERENLFTRAERDDGGEKSRVGGEGCRVWEKKENKNKINVTDGLEIKKKTGDNKMFTSGGPYERNRNRIYVSM